MFVFPIPARSILLTPYILVSLKLTLAHVFDSAVVTVQCIMLKMMEFFPINFSTIYIEAIDNAFKLYVT